METLRTNSAGPSRTKKSFNDYIALLESVVNKPWRLVCTFFGVVIASGFLYDFIEGKGFFDGLWWTFVTGYTVGYGDLYPVSIPGRVMAVLLMSMMILFIVPCITAQLSSKLIVDLDKFSHEEQEALKSELASTRARLDSALEKIDSLTLKLDRLLEEVDGTEELGESNGRTQLAVLVAVQQLSTRLDGIAPVLPRPTGRKWLVRLKSLIGAGV